LSIKLSKLKDPQSQSRSRPPSPSQRRPSTSGSAGTSEKAEGDSQSQSDNEKLLVRCYDDEKKAQRPVLIGFCETTFQQLRTINSRLSLQNFAESTHQTTGTFIVKQVTITARKPKRVKSP